MSKRSARVLVDDMWEAMERVEQYTANMSQEAFLRDPRTSDAVVRNFEIIGEAANQLPADFKQQHADVEWIKIVGLRHRIVHDYFDIDLQLVWQILQKDLPTFKAKLQRLR